MEHRGPQHPPPLVADPGPPAVDARHARRQRGQRAARPRGLGGEPHVVLIAERDVACLRPRGPQEVQEVRRRPPPGPPDQTDGRAARLPRRLGVARHDRGTLVARPVVGDDHRGRAALLRGDAVELRAEVPGPLMKREEHGEGGGGLVLRRPRRGGPGRGEGRVLPLPSASGSRHGRPSARRGGVPCRRTGRGPGPSAIRTAPQPLGPARAARRIRRSRRGADAPAHGPSAGAGSPRGTAPDRPPRAPLPPLGAAASSASRARARERPARPMARRRAGSRASVATASAARRHVAARDHEARLAVDHQPLGRPAAVGDDRPARRHRLKHRAPERLREMRQRQHHVRLRHRLGRALGVARMDRVGRQGAERVHVRGGGADQPDLDQPVQAARDLDRVGHALLGEVRADQRRAETRPRRGRGHRQQRGVHRVAPDRDPPRRREPVGHERRVGDEAIGGPQQALADRLGPRAQRLADRGVVGRHLAHVDDARHPLGARRDQGGVDHEGVAVNLARRLAGDDPAQGGQRDGVRRALGVPPAIGHDVERLGPRQHGVAVARMEGPRQHGHGRHPLGRKAVEHVEEASLGAEQRGLGRVAEHQRARRPRREAAGDPRQGIGPLGHAALVVVEEGVDAVPQPARRAPARGAEAGARVAPARRAVLHVVNGGVHLGAAHVLVGLEIPAGVEQGRAADAVGGLALGGRVAEPDRVRGVERPPGRAAREVEPGRPRARVPAARRLVVGPPHAPGLGRELRPPPLRQRGGRHPAERQRHAGQDLGHGLVAERGADAEVELGVGVDAHPVPVAQPLPQRGAEQQRGGVAVDETPLLPPDREVEVGRHPQPVRRGGDRRAAGEMGRHLRLDLARVRPVVGVVDGDEGAAGLREPEVARGVGADLVRAQHADPRLARRPRLGRDERAVARAVLDHQHLQRGPALRQDRAQRGGKRALGVARGHDDADERGVGRRPRGPARGQGAEAVEGRGAERALQREPAQPRVGERVRQRRHRGLRPRAGRARGVGPREAAIGRGRQGAQHPRRVGPRARPREGPHGEQVGARTLHEDPPRGLGAHRAQMSRRGPPLLARGMPACERPGGEDAVAGGGSAGRRLQPLTGAGGESAPQVALVQRRVERRGRAPLRPAVAEPVPPGVEPRIRHVGMTRAVPRGVEEGRRRGRPAERASRAGREPAQVHSTLPLTG